MESNWVPIHVSGKVLSCGTKLLTVNSVKDHQVQSMGHRTWLWCCQDAARRKKAKKKEGDGSIHRDTVGMSRYDCDSSLIVLCRMANPGSTDRIIRVKLQHFDNHVPYYDV